MTPDPWSGAYTAVSELLGRYCHAIDTGDRDRLANCFAPDSSLEVDGSTIASGSEQIAAELTKRASTTTMHFSYPPSIVFDSNGEEVRSRSYFVSVDTSTGVRRSMGVCVDVVHLRPANGSTFLSRSIDFRWRAE